MDEILAIRLIHETYECLVLRILRQQGADLGRCQIQRPAGLGVEAHLDCPLPSAIHIDGGNAIDILQVGTDLFVNEIAHPVDAARATYLQHHKVVRQLRHVYLHQLDGEAVGQRGRHLVYFLLQTKRRDLEIDRMLEIDLYARLPAVDIRLYLLHPTDRTDRPLERDNRLRLHIRWIHILPRSYLHEHHRQLGIGQQLHRQLLVGHIPQQGQRHKQHTDLYSSM